MTHRPLDPCRIGMLTPSSNTVLEPYTSAMLAPFGDAASAHFGRFRVVEISMSEASQSQFSLDPILDAAERLAEAHPHVIAWNGTSASWLGMDKDRALCAAITERTGVAATSTMLAYDGLMRGLGVRQLGLVTPYVGDIERRMIANYAAQGIDVVGAVRLDETDNYSFASYPPDRVAEMAARVAKARPDAIAIVCTNFRGAPIAARIEDATGIPVIDSVAVTAAHTLRKVGLDPARVTGWGSVFQRVATIAPVNQT
ncbi:Asp/Glu/hydantoin racemase [Salipiger aestuarii]|uniref:maleate cis-trans isomerase family protein n=1 Tax=Salipiger aestuarii TaxID=568098 RepID=UPI00025B637A|nr:aspartate/glutamate racemase family protein [Salipiger aestuarii]EIE52954.1 Asp/Glu racemase [Citreicella sp. 357]KAA8606317.1 Asp/Glu/hydantoin racemase [Salipiger aestuarii]KAA8610240.1 Asp/Glu/hydantoin racemase [Salipiger aestuarii]